MDSRELQWNTIVVEDIYVSYSNYEGDEHINSMVIRIEDFTAGKARLAAQALMHIAERSVSGDVE